MRKAMAEAEVGDDVFEGDPTVKKLEATDARLLGHESALFVPSGTMANQIALRMLTRPGDEVICEVGAHIINYEVAAASALSGIQLSSIDIPGGILTPEVVEPKIRPENIHHPNTSVLALENTHNRAGGNVYPLVDIDSGGATEETCPEPVGEYAQSRLGGERVAQYVAERQGTKLVIVRLFYAVEMRYGILHDLARKILDDEPIDVTMGHVNQIWQGDAVGYLIQFLTIADCPARTINVTGPDILPVRELGRMFAEHMGKKARFVGAEADTALLGNSDEAFKLFGVPPTSAETVVRWMGAWVARGGESLGKPTKYERRDGKF